MILYQVAEDQGKITIMTLEHKQQKKIKNLLL